jgi:cytochrome c biogenesis protein ResB
VSSISASCCCRRRSSASSSSRTRVWARIEPAGDEGQFTVLIGGNTNRSRVAFEDRFKRLIAVINEQFEAQQT